MTKMGPGLAALAVLLTAGPAAASDVVSGGRVIGRVIPGLAGAQNVYADGSYAGMAVPVGAARWSALAGGTELLGSARRAGDRWDIYKGDALVGSATKANARWDIFGAGEKPRIGYVRGGPGGAAAGAALILLLR
jgi:hypothetical protein